MLTVERRKRILEFIKGEGKAEVASLAKHFGVSTMTIRRDLNALDSEGLLERARGGALANAPFVQEIPYHFKANSNIEAKQKIAKAAAEMISDKDTIILDSGSTTLEIAKYLKKNNNKQLTVVTNDLNIALELADVPTIKVFTTGGQVQPGTYCLFGEDAQFFLRNINVDILFLGSGAIDALEGIYTPTLEKAHLKRAMIASSRKVILVADQSKFGHRAFAKICDIETVDIVISDKLMDTEVSVFKELGIQTILV